jgi:hypothetical protein
VGDGKGEGFNVNIPWARGGEGDADYMVGAGCFGLVIGCCLPARSHSSSDWLTGDSWVPGKWRETEQRQRLVVHGWLVQSLQTPSSSSRTGGSQAL